MDNPPTYIGRLAPSPTGLLHLGHARTFWIAQQRAQAAGGQLLLRNDDLDQPRCKPEFAEAFVEDLSWLGLKWWHPILSQNIRLPIYQEALAQLHAASRIYPCRRSRKELIAAAATAPAFPFTASSSSTQPHRPSLLVRHRCRCIHLRRRLFRCRLSLCPRSNCRRKK